MDAPAPTHRSDSNRRVQPGPDPGADHPTGAGAEATAIGAFHGLLPGKGWRLAGLLAMAVLMAAGCGSNAPSAIAMTSVHATADLRVPSDPRQVAVFVETGATSEHCLATLQESQLKAPVQELYCAHRTATFDGGATHVEGIWIHVFFAGDPGDAMDLWVTAYQEGATTYGEPTYCFTEQGC